MSKVTPLVVVGGWLAQMQAADQIQPQNLGSGDSDGTKFLRDDGVWSAPPVAATTKQHVSYLYGGL